MEHTQDGSVTLSPLKGAKTFVNGVLLTTAQALRHNDRLILGANQVFRFAHPGTTEALEATKKETPTYEGVIQEKLRKQGESLQHQAASQVHTP